MRFEHHSAMMSEVAAFMTGNFDGAMFGLNSGEKLLSACALGRFSA
ncbi:MAG: hypothetical protein ACI4JY_05380 [Oscillospiraceae bacterium]